jgi:xylulokinase
MAALTGIGRDDQYVLAVDLGTGGPKVGLVSLTGIIACKEHLPVDTHRTHDGGATQDSERWWQLICASARRMVGSRVVPAERIVAVSCTGQWASTVPVDAAGHPVGECLLWLDSRGADLTRDAVGGPIGGYAPLAATRWIRHSGGAPSTSGADPIGHMLYIEHELPYVARAARWYLEPVDYLSMRFTGVAAASPASMAGAWLTDNRHPERLEYDPVLVRSAGVPLEKLPQLVATGSVVGTVLPEVAAALGLGPGVTVVTGTPDLHSAAVGAGAVLAYEAHLAISTTSWLSCPYPKKKTDPIRQIATVPGIIGGLYLVANNQESGGGALEWLRRCLSDGRHEPYSYEQLTDLAAEAAPGCGGVLFTPWLAGERSPVDNRAARAGFHNLSLQTSRPDMVRAVMEGVAFNTRWLCEGVERFVGQPLDPIRAIGGGAISSLWCSVYANILNRSIEQVADPQHANLRGSALLAGMALGRVEPREIRSLVPVKAIHHPEPELRQQYDRIFGEFPALYSAQKGLFARLNRPKRARVGRSGPGRQPLFG